MNKSRTTTKPATAKPATTPRPALKSPYPYFGGKSRAAHLVWARLGDVQSLVVPFFGSGAELLARPADHTRGVETVNDIDAFIANFWRAVQAEPQTVARHADWPVNETDMEARHKWLCQRDRKAEFAKRMRDDPHYYCAKTAGWWVWGISAWIGQGWCNGEYVAPDSAENRGAGIATKTGKRPHLTGHGMGIHSIAVEPEIRSGKAWKKMPHVLGGSGVHRKTVTLTEWFAELQARLRRVRVLCYDWQRIVRPSIVDTGKITGVILDPPYSADAGRAAQIYRCESLTVAHEVRDWAVANGDKPNLRIALCGYDGEHVMPKSWTEVAWKAQGGYGNLGAKRGVRGGSDGEGRGQVNRHRERIWFSPHCIDCGDLPGGVVIHAGAARGARASRHRKGGGG